MNTHSAHTGLQRLIYFCLAVAGACFFTLASLSSPALADDTDGGSGQGTGSGGDGCIKSGWRLVNDVDDVVWQDDGYQRECGNTAYGNRNNWTHREFTDETGTLHVCDTRGGSYSSNCNGEWQNANTPLYSALGNMGANACFRRTDLHGIWYLQDAGLDGIKSWTNLGTSPDGNHRTVNALKDAIDDSWDTTRHELVDSGDRGDADWWDTRIKRWQGEKYEANIAYYLRVGQTRAQAVASVRSDAKADLAATIKDVAGSNPVIFCWYNTIEKSDITCAQQMPSGMEWSDYLHPDGVTRDSTGVAECIRRCPTAQGDYPDTLPHAGEYIPNANGSIRPRPASNSENDIADYCYPPIISTWHQGSYGSGIPGIGYTEQATHGSNATATQPYTYVTTVEDGNGAYESTSQTGNAPGQGQFTASTATKKTAFGIFVDSYCSGSASCSSGQIGDPGSAEYNRFVAAYNAAVAALPNEAHATLNLTASQQAQVAKGRILNVVERTVYTSAQARRLLDRFFTRLLTRTIYYNLNGRERATQNTTSDWQADAAAHASWNNEAVPSDMRNVYRPTFPDGTTFANAHPDVQKWDHGETVYGSTPKVSGLWQNAVTHCNNQEFAPLNPDGQAESPNETGVIDTGDTSQYYSASAVFRVSDSQWRLTDSVDLSKARWGALAGVNNPSNRPAFFDRLCYYPGSVKDPLSMGSTGKAADGSYTFFRDGERHTIEKASDGGGAAVSPFFVPDFKGEDRHSTVTIVDGYRAKKSTLTASEYWTVSYQSYDVTGTTTQTVPDTSRPLYSGTFTDSLADCASGIGQIGGDWSSEDNWSAGGVWKPASGNATAAKGGISDGVQYLKCAPAYNNGGPVDKGDGSGNWDKKRTYKLKSTTYPFTKTETVNTYGWQGHSASFTTEASASTAYNYCVAYNGSTPGRTRNCVATKTEAAWSTPTTVAVPSCPMADTGTVRYTECETVTHDEDVVTNYNVVDYQNEDPTQVIVTRDPLSTPDASLGTVFGLTNGGDAAQIFSDDPSDTRTPKSEDVYQSQFASNPTFASSTVAVSSGAYKRLQAKAVWSSDTGLPQVITLAWYYTPKVKSTFAMTDIGFGRSGGLMTYTKGETSTPVRGRVEATSNSLTVEDGASLADHQNEVWENSGTSIVDGLNVPLYYGQAHHGVAPFKWTQDPTRVSEHYFTVRFVRAVGE